MPHEVSLEGQGRGLSGFCGMNRSSNTCTAGVGLLSSWAEQDKAVWHRMARTWALGVHLPGRAEQVWGGLAKALQKWPGQSWRTSCCHFRNVPQRLTRAGCYPDTVPALLGVQGSGQRGEEAKTLPPVTGAMEETNRGLDGESWRPYMEEQMAPGPAACRKGARKNIPSIKGDLGKFQKLSGGPRGCCTGHHWMKSLA